jgi:type II secretory pathway predicted ATPase ExeA
MYEAHFGLQESPFGITPNPAFFYSGNTRGEILQGLLYVVAHGEGIIKVTGEVGSGKTMLCRMLEEQLPPHIEAIYLVNPSLSPLEVLFAIAGELGLNPDGKRSDEVLRELHADLIAKYSAGKQVVLLVEEAQAMPLDTLEEIRLLTNLETARHKLLQIVLFGQPELDDHLNLSSMRQLKERITHSFEVPAMPAELVPEFLDFRLRAAGYQGEPVFSEAAARLIARASKGIVRRINILADKALMAAFADDASSVTAAHARAALRDSPYQPGLALKLGSRSSIDRTSAVLSVLIVVLLAGLVYQFRHLPDASARPSPAAVPAAATAAPAAATPAAVLATSTPAPLTLLQQSLRASKTWLRDEPAGHLSLLIETMPSGDHKGLETFLRNTRQEIGLAQVHAVPLRQGGEDKIAIFYGSFASLAEAQKVQALLVERWSFRPLIRDIRDMREDAKAAPAVW